MESHLLQMRGLKHKWSNQQEEQRLSHLLQMRGLKLKARKRERDHLTSHLLQMRGLKLPLLLVPLLYLSRIFYRCVD